MIPSHHHLGERNFGVRLNKPFTSRGVIDVQAFTGTHADLLIIVSFGMISLDSTMTILTYKPVPTYGFKIFSNKFFIIGFDK